VRPEPLVQLVGEDTAWLLLVELQHARGNLEDLGKSLCAHQSWVTVRGTSSSQPATLSH
jgi:hypothetical protein